MQRLLGWQSQELDVISTSEVRALVQRHGEAIRAAEALEVERWEGRDDLHRFSAQLVGGTTPRRRAAWFSEMTEAVEQALTDPNPMPPQGVSSQDWQRVLQARANEATCWSVERLRYLGPEIQTGQTIAAIDDILVRRPEPGRWLTLRIARVATQSGYRYFSGTGTLVLRQLYLLLVFCGGLFGWVTVLGDGAKWLREFIEKCLKSFRHKEFLLDWYHLHAHLC